jgi:hypothetical protein
MIVFDKREGVSYFKILKMRRNMSFATDVNFKVEETKETIKE